MKKQIEEIMQGMKNLWGDKNKTRNYSNMITIELLTSWTIAVPKNLS